MEVVGLILGTTGLLAVADKALSLAQLIRAITNVPKDLAGLLFKLANESGKIYLWSRDTMQLVQPAIDQKYSIKETSFVVAMRSKLNQDEAGIIAALDQARDLCDKYGLSDAMKGPKGDETSVSARLTSTSDVQKVGKDEEVDKHISQLQQTSDLVKKRMSAFRKTRFVFKPWGTSDMEKLTAIVSELQYWNGELESLLTQVQLKAIRDQQAFYVMACADETQTLQIIQQNADPIQDRELIASAHLGEQKLIAESNEASEEYKIPWKLLKIITPASNSRSFGRYEFQPGKTF
jgi:Prion-inhibition and propagation